MKTLAPDYPLQELAWAFSNEPAFDPVLIVHPPTAAPAPRGSSTTAIRAKVCGVQPEQDLRVVTLS
jgi:hypothetical protein